MPVYQYECQSCKMQFEATAKIDERKAPQECPGCGSWDSKNIITAVGLNFPGDDWATKNNRIAGQMKEKNARLHEKEQEYGRSGQVPKLMPNVGGEQVDSWSEASKLAKSKGKDSSGYDRLARKEEKAS